MVSILWSSLLVLAWAPATSEPGGAAFKVDPATAQSLFGRLAGRWACKGAFANGKPLAADLAFVPSLDGLALRYSHIDRAPNSYRQDSHWVVDSESGQLVSLAATSFAKGKGNAAVYFAEALTDAGVRFGHKRLIADPFAPNRFTYSLGDNGELKMVWEVERGGTWRMGDYLDCERSATATPER